MVAETVNVAVASNFVSTLERIEIAFEAGSDHDLRIVRGSSGKHYAQISNGAPFDVFMSADQMRPKRLMEDGRAVAGSLRTYAIGQLALWSATDGNVLGREYLLNTDNYQSISMANPRLAPYGFAASQLIENLGLTESLEGKTVTGENIAQAFQFAYSGNAELGIVAYSQTLAEALSGRGSSWKIPNELHDPIAQDMVIIKDSQAARDFAKFMDGHEVRSILLDSGYLLPERLP